MDKQSPDFSPLMLRRALLFKTRDQSMHKKEKKGGGDDAIFHRSLKKIIRNLRYMVGGGQF